MHNPFHARTGISKQMGANDTTGTTVHGSKPEHKNPEHQMRQWAEVQGLRRRHHEHEREGLCGEWELCGRAHTTVPGLNIVRTRGSPSAICNSWQDGARRTQAVVQG